MSDSAADFINWADPARHHAFDAWLQAVAPAHGLAVATLRSASADASFRRYFRIDAQSGASFIVMDAPPPLEDVRPFISVAALLQSAGLNAPRVVEQDVGHGFLLLTDLGAQLYLGVLQAAVISGDLQTADTLMRDATAALIQWQLRADASALPAYDDALLRRELALFPEWCVARELGATWTKQEQAVWQDACDLLVQSALAQPTVAVHRDYMPRNLMVCAKDTNGAGSPGILDFQDAVRGPIAYDLASLLRDAFISWEEAQELDWAVRYWQAARSAGLPMPEDFGEFWRQVEWMGLQRHLKVLGIFCRLKHRDGKPKYSEDLPRFFAYAHKVSARYNALRPLSRLLEPLMGAERVEVFR
ncbi:MAG: phosphotransferase [Burkholderiales bacterium]|nr:phosphotransferase [Burkholderiales bacterium]